MYTLDYPNREVKVSLLDNLLSAYREVFPGTSMSVTADLRTALEQGDICSIINELNAVIGSIPYEHWRADTESIFHIITQLTNSSYQNDHLKGLFLMVGKNAQRQEN